MTRLRLVFPDNLVVALLVAAALVLAGRACLAAHPGANPWAPLDLRDPPGWATQGKLADLRTDDSTCRTVLARSEVAFAALEPIGTGDCARPDRVLLASYPFAPDRPPTTCAVAAGLSLWLERSVKPAAMAELGAPLARIEHLGAWSCRRMYGRDSGPWSEHATDNAIDIAAFVLADGRRVLVLGDWGGGGPKAAFLRRVRDGACDGFSTVLSPEYNAAHRDHFHLDQAVRGRGGICR